MEKKLQGQNNRNTRLKFAIVVVSILLVLTIVVTLFLYTNINIRNLQIENLESEKQNLVNEIDLLVAPKLVDSLRWIDNNQTVHIYGEVWNVGGDRNPISTAGDAYYCGLHVVLYRDDVVVKKTLIKIGDYIGHIAPEKYARVNATIPYDGAPIMKVEITPEIGSWE